MTREQELKKIGRKLFGYDWIKPLAIAMGIKNSSIFVKWLNPENEATITEKTMKRIRRLDDREEWLLCLGADTGLKYIQHTIFPRFTCRFIEKPTLENTEGLLNIYFECSEGQVFCDFVWADTAPDSAVIYDLLSESESFFSQWGSIDGK